MLRWALPGVVATAALVGAAVPAAAAATHPANRRPSAVVVHRLARLTFNHQSYASPTLGSRRLAYVYDDRPLTGQQTTLPVVATDQVADGTTWLQVMLPGRPNHSLGWIRSAGTTEGSTAFTVVVNTATRTMEIDENGREVKSATVVVGKSSTPTPLGTYFVEEVLAMPASAVGAPIAFALSARSDALQEFDGGPGQIALHGLGNVGGVLGTAVSHGCIRVDTATLEWMATRVGPGATVTIER